MTVRIPQPTIGDKILSYCGKSRAVTVPGDVYHKFGPYVTVCLKKESFLSALLRPTYQYPPDGWFYINDCISNHAESTITGDEPQWGDSD